ELQKQQTPPRRGLIDYRRSAGGLLFLVSLQPCLVGGDVLFLTLDGLLVLVNLFRVLGLGRHLARGFILKTAIGSMCNASIAANAVVQAS
ncbi:MAG: hypothetical protein Q8M83_00030, partial [bacterium]|nr:hypothetical protein [bacterium]